jgi:hypothetical protein
MGAEGRMGVSAWGQVGLLGSKIEDILAKIAELKNNFERS